MRENEKEGISKENFITSVIVSAAGSDRYACVDILSAEEIYGNVPYVGKPDNRICRSYSVWKTGKRRVWIFDVSAGRQG